VKDIRNFMRKII